MTARRPGCDFGRVRGKDTQLKKSVSIAVSYRDKRERRIVPPSAAGRHSLHFEARSNVSAEALERAAASPAAGRFRVDQDCGREEDGHPDEALSQEAPADPVRKPVARVREPGLDDEVVEAAPREGEPDEGDLHEQDLPVPLRPRSLRCGRRTMLR